MKVVNSEDVAPDTILKQMGEPRPLPMGRADFEEWSDRIISGALVPPGSNDEDPALLVQSQKFALANMLMHLGPTESHKPDAHFIHQLRKVVINQVANNVIQEFKESRKKAQEEKEAQAKDAEANEG